ncbi:MAG: NUDIX domain-containing protein [Cyanobacteria bacterium P01_D01_bin.156]
MSKIIDKVGWILIQDQKLLCVRSYGKTLFYIPGGKRESGESDRKTLSREIQEELSVTIASEISYLDTFSAPADGKNADVIVTVKCYQADFLGKLQPSAEIEEMKWLGSGDLALCSKATIAILNNMIDKGLVM